MKRILLGLLLMAGTMTALGQAPVAQLDISADQLLGGNADEPLKELGAKAASEGLEITITAPAYWHDLVSEQIVAGAGDQELAIAYRETIIESVIVRLQEPGAAPGQPSRSSSTANAAPAPNGPVGPAPEAPEINTRSAREQAEAELREQAREAVAANAEPLMPETRDLVAPLPVTVAPVSAPPTEVAEPPAGEPEKTLASDQASAGEPVAPEPEPIQAAPAEAAAEQPAEAEVQVAEAPAPAESDESDRASLERRLNDGRAIEKSLAPGQLRRGDQLFRTGEWVAVVRSSRVGLNTYWLEGELELDENKDIKRIQAGKFEVLRRPRVPEAEEPEAPADEGVAAAGDAVESEEVLDERAEMEARYNGGRPVEQSISVSGLRPDDILYLGDSLVMVVRRDRVSLRRYWLEGSLDLERDELERQGNRKYRVRRQIR